MKEANSSDYLIRICDQTGKEMKTLYACITKELVEIIVAKLEATEEDWD